MRLSRALASKTQVRPRRDDQGFTLVELMIASALALVIMSVAFGAVIESQRTINTAMARNSDENAAQALVNRIELGVRAATSVGVMCWSGSAWASCSSAPAIWQSPPSTELWIYDSTATTPCTAWILTGSTSGYYLELATGTTHSTMSTPSVELSGITAGSFSYFTNFPGLVDVNLAVQHATSGLADGYQQQSSASQLEAEVDDPNMSGAVTSGYGNC
jgi:prepilin-type N-terminal cleavage/methylation domain-containing protein